MPSKEEIAQRKAQLAIRRDRLSRENRERLETFLQRASEEPHAELIPRRQPGESSIPLSFAQQRLWLLDQMDPGSPLYNIPVSLRLTGRLNIVALEQSLNEIIRRHESLRARFLNLKGAPAQVISEFRNISLTLIDLAQVTKGGDKPLRSWLREEQSQGLDLERGPLMRAKLLLLSNGEHILLVTTHHIASDGWSSDVLVRELTHLYQVYREGGSSSLPEPPIQYADFAVWQRDWLQRGALEEQLGYWRQKLAGAPVLELPTDRRRPAVASHSGAVEEFVLSTDLSRRLGDLGRRASVTRFMILLAGFQALLARYTGQEDIAVGTPIAGRNRPEIQGLIGCFVNTLVMRTDFKGNPTVKELLGRVRETTLGAYAHQDLPFEKLVETLQPERSRNRHQLFQVMFAYRNIQLGTLEVSDLQVHSEPIEAERAMFDMTLALFEEEGYIRGLLEYSGDLFESDRIKRMIGHLERLLKGIANDEDCRVMEIPLLSEPELRQALVEWNMTEAAYAAEKCLHEVFEQQVEQTPDAIALMCEDRQLSYAELNRRSNQLAHWLMRYGAGPEMRVGVCLERGQEMVIALLGALKAGAAYVPIDPFYPAERLSIILNDAQIPILLTQKRLLDSFLVHTLQVVCMDSDEAWMKSEFQANPVCRVGGKNPAYVIYTSGSTGTPKGAVNTHEGIYNRLMWMQKAYGLTERDCVLQKTVFNFDVSVWEFFWPLMAGGRLVMARPGGHQESAYLKAVIIEQQITIAHFVPPMLRVFLDEPDMENCGCLRLVICSGEVLPFDLQQRFFALLSAELHNLYGPTEAAVDVTSWRCEREAKRSSVPIGKPITNTQIYLLDNRFQPAPIGVPGELHIGGAGLMRSYLNNPELTAEKLIPNGFSGDPGRRLYKTGDLACHLPDGNIEFLGRIDGQVKVRGFRIELGEIEAALNRHQAVSKSVVVVNDTNNGDKRLVGYIVPRSGQVVDAGHLQAHLRAILPGYMAPNSFAIIDELPLTQNGKVDRKAVPSYGRALNSSSRPFLAPRNIVEKKLAELWGELLGVERVSIYDNFFDLGGHSLLLTRLSSAIRAHFKVEVPLRKLFDGPRIVDMTKAILDCQINNQDRTRAAELVEMLSRMPPDKIKALLEAETLTK